MGTEKTNALLSAISRAQAHFLEDDKPNQLFEELLADFLQLAESECGFIGEVLEASDGAPYLKTHAITNVAWNADTRRFFEEGRRDGLVFCGLDNLFGEVIRANQLVISNAPASDPRSVGVPEGHPPLSAFMGMPVMAGNQIVGMIGIANRVGGYNAELAKFLEPLLDTYGRIISLMRANKERSILQQRLSAIVDTAVDAIVVIDDKGFVTSCNQAAESIFGYESCELIGCNISLLMPQPYQSHHDEYLGRYKKTGEARVVGGKRVNVNGLRANGDVFPMQLSVSEFFVDGERYFTGMVRDLSEVNRIRGDLSRYKETLDQIQDCVFIFDPTTLRFSYVNQGAIKQVGYSRDELLEMHPYDIKPEYTESQFRKLIDPVINGDKESITFATEYQHKDGHRIPVEVLLQYVAGENEEPSRVVTVVRDVTERNEAQRALRISDERLRRSQVIANIGTWDWNIKTGELYCSERIGPLFGYPQEKLETSYDNFLHAVHPDDRQMVIDAINACIEQGKEYNIEHRCIWPSGEVRWMLGRGDVVRGDNGEPLRMLGVLHDVTDLKSTQLELQKAKDEAERASRAKSEFLSSMSHELRTPLNAIMGFAQLFQYDPTASDSHKDNAQEIYGAGLHLRRLIDDILDLARVEAGHFDISLESILFDDVVRESLTLVTPLADERDIELIINMEDQCHHVCVSADQTRLKQVLINLLSNAIKYNRKHGKVTLTCEVPRDGFIRLCVADTGIGIARKNFKAVFVPFSRVHSGMWTAEGTGIGLSITRQFVELMGGAIGFESELGKGSTFWVDLKLADGCVIDDRLDEIHSLETNAEGKLKRLLVVEDNVTNRKILLLQLKVLGYAADMASDGRRAIEALDAHHYDLILSDIHMPEMNGYELITYIRNKERGTGGHIPVVAVTANAMEGERARLLAAGMDAYVTKPVDINTLEKVLKELLDGQQDPALGGADSQAGTPAISCIETDPVDLSLLNSLVGADARRHREIIDSFIAGIPNSIQSIHRARASHDSQGVVFSSHYLKSAARSIGAVRLAELCQAMEKAGRKNDREQISMLEDEIDAELQSVVYFLRNYMLEDVPELAPMPGLSFQFALLIDDEPITLSLLSAVLESLGMDRTVTTASGREALEALDDFSRDVDIIFCDLNMPEMDGIEFLRHLAKRDYQGSIVLLSGEDQRVLSSALALARAHRFKSVAALEKPVEREALLGLLAGMAGGQSRRKKKTRPHITEQELKHAIDQDEFVVYFQPKVNPCCKDEIGAEALVRWQHPEKGIVLPDEFIPLAEETGLIDGLTDLVLEKSFAQQAVWQGRGLNLKISVNIAAGTIGRRINFPEQVMRCLDLHGLLPETIILELTESGVMKDIAATLDTLVRLRLKGVTLSIDDFGTGYSTFKQLQGIPFGELKIDKSFVINANHEPSCRAILESSVMLGQKLGMTIVAEGVQTQQDWDLIQSLGCHMVQGYFVSRPLPVNEFDAWMAEWRRS